MTFDIPSAATEELPAFLESLEGAKDLQIHDMQLSLTTLEEVFMKIGMLAYNLNPLRLTYVILSLSFVNSE